MWYANAPWASTGYGNPTRLLVKHLTNLGHKLAVACNYGLRGAKLGSEAGVVLYPGGYDANSNDIVQAHADDFKADVIVSLYDVWPLDFKNLKTPWIAWTPIDHSPVPLPVLESVRPDLYPPKGNEKKVPATHVVAMSQFGLYELERARVKASFIPLGVDTQAFKLCDRREARQRLGLPEKKFIVSMVAANKSYPSRKCLVESIQAFAEFRKHNPDALLYLHTEESGFHHGHNLPKLIKALGLGPDALVMCDQYQYVLGFPDAYMADVFNASNVLLSPSMAEGFGIPIIEAQASGTPAIVTDFSSMQELVQEGVTGWRIDDYEKVWSEQGAWQVKSKLEAIKMALFHARAQATDSMRDACRENAVQYDFEKAVAPLWDELLRGLTLTPSPSPAGRGGSE
jgi:glycosyltransferase involved in cell wall biosynthesis